VGVHKFFCKTGKISSRTPLRLSVVQGDEALKKPSLTTGKTDLKRAPELLEFEECSNQPSSYVKKRYKNMTKVGTIIISVGYVMFVRAARTLGIPYGVKRNICKERKKQTKTTMCFVTPVSQISSF